MRSPLALSKKKLYKILVDEGKRMAKYKRGTTLYDYCIAERKLWILEQFDSEKNYPLTPFEVTKSSDKKVWFTHACGHSCLQRVADKTGKDSYKCPACLNRSDVGKSLLSEYPDYAQMFISSKNGISPDKVSFQNGKSYFWKCPRCSNEFKGKVSDVVNGNRVCGECSNKKRSYPEYCLAYYLETVDPHRILDYNLEGYKFDFFLPKYNLIVEYDGYPWHNPSKAKNNDAIKDSICRKNRVPLLRLRDKRLDINPNLTADIWSFDYDGKFSFLSNLGCILEPYLGEEAKLLDIDVDRDKVLIRSFQFRLNSQESLLSVIPTISEYIDETDPRNGNPAFVNNASHKIRFWFRHPQYPKLKWSMTAHRLFHKKEPFNQRIKMCFKMIERYPKLSNQIIAYGESINEQSIFTLTCHCGNEFSKNYAALMGKRTVTMCNDCLKSFRYNNLHK